MAFELKKKSSAASSSKSEKPAAKGAVGLLKTGKDAVAAMQKADAEREARKNAAGKPLRFRMKVGEDATITFLDGRIDPDTGILDIPYANEHTLKVGDRWENFICTEDEEPCPICAAGEKKAFVGYLTVMDHRPYEYEKDGKKVTVEHSRRLYVAKTDTLKQLQKMAEKNEDGLVGATYEVSRTGDKKPNVGDYFEKVAIHEKSDLVEAFGDEADPLNYSEHTPLYSAAQLAEMGVGKKVATIGSKSFGAKKADDVDDGDMPW